MCVCVYRESECDEMSQAFPTMLVYSKIVGRLALLSLNTKKSSFHWFDFILMSPVTMVTQGHRKDFWSSLIVIGTCAIF